MPNNEELIAMDDAVVTFDSATIALVGRIETQEKCDSVVATLRALRPFLKARARAAA